MEYRKSEIRAGVFLLTAFVVFAAMVFSVSDIASLFRTKKEIRALFTATEGIDLNAQVRFSGIRIGSVKRIRVAHEHEDKVELVLSVLDDTVIKEDASAAIKTLGLIGRKYVELSGGSADARPLPPDGILYGEDALKMEDLTKAGLEVVAKVRHIAQSLDRLLGDPALARNIKGTLQNVEAATANIKAMTENKEQVNEAVRSLPVIMQKIDANLANLKAVLEKTETVVGRTDATLADNRKQIDATMENMKEISRNLKDLTEDVKQNPWKLIRKP